MISFGLNAGKFRAEIIGYCSDLANLEIIIYFSLRNTFQ